MMVIDNSLVKDVREHVLHLLEHALSEDLTYHSINHTKEVVSCANEIALRLRFDEVQLEILNIAAWFHDVGYIRSCEAHELWSAKMARNYLEQQHYPEERIQSVEDCIMATKMPQNPQNTIEKALCDADLMHLADENYFQKADLLHQEIERTRFCTIPENEWLKMNQEFLGKHCFFTEYARKKYDDAVKRNLRKVRERLKSWQKAKK